MEMNLVALGNAMQPRQVNQRPWDWERDYVGFNVVDALLAFAARLRTMIKALSRLSGRSKRLRPSKI
jgi:hypothetical protein